MRLRVIGCIVVTVLIVGMYAIIAYGDDLGIVHPVNRTASLSPVSSEKHLIVDNNQPYYLNMSPASIVDNNNVYTINWSD